MKATTRSGSAPNAAIVSSARLTGLGRRPTPSGVDGCQDPCLGVEQGHGNAVGDEDGQGRIGCGRDQDVGGGDGIVHPQRSPAALGVTHDGGRGAVHLFGEDDGVQFDPEGIAPHVSGSR